MLLETVCILCCFILVLYGDLEPFWSGTLWLHCLWWWWLRCCHNVSNYFPCSNYLCTALFSEIPLAWQVWVCCVWRRWKSEHLTAGDGELLPTIQFSCRLPLQLPELSMLSVSMFFCVQSQSNRSTFGQCLNTCVRVFQDVLFCKHLFCRDNMCLPYFKSFSGLSMCVLRYCDCIK